MGALKELPQITVDMAMTFLTSRSVRLISWTCRALQHMIKTKDFFVCASCLASENMILPAITTVAERALQRAIEEYRLQRPELVRTAFHPRSLEGIAGQLEQETAGY